MKLALLLLFAFAAEAVELRVEVAPQWPQTISITRLDFLLSDFALEARDGSWVQANHWQAYISSLADRKTFTMSNLPPMNCAAIRFNVGLSSDLNKKDPAGYPPDHPLNPVLNGLHWGWQGGYVFLALEGKWGVNKENGFSFHLANDPQLMHVEIPLEIDLSVDTSIALRLDVNKILDGVALNEENSSTHSRAGDPLALRLKQNVERSFSAHANLHIAEAPKTGGDVPLISSNATPYKFTFSATFPRPALPMDNPLTEEGVELGRRLFTDTRLSRNGNQSCASCHDLKTAGVDAGRAFSVGTDGTLGTRNSMPLFNLAWKQSFFWDGRAASLREQVLQPIQNPVEMHESLTNAVRKLNTGDDRKQFQRAFGSSEVTSDQLARSLEQYLLTLTSDRSKCDKVLAGNAEFTDEEERGFQLFHSEYDPRREQYGADCFHCHGGPLFQSVNFANNGLDLVAKDTGRFDVTGKEADRGKFATPSLRNVAITGPYMHDGRFKTLEEVVAHYSEGVKRSPTLDPNLAKHPNGGVQLSKDDQRALVAFLKTLTDEQFLEARIASTNGSPRDRD